MVFTFESVVPSISAETSDAVVASVFVIKEHFALLLLFVSSKLNLNESERVYSITHRTLLVWNENTALKGYLCLSSSDHAMKGDATKTPDNSPAVPIVHVNPPFLTKFATVLIVFPTRVLLSQLSDNLSWYVKDAMECNAADDDLAIIIETNIDTTQSTLKISTRTLSSR